MGAITERSYFSPDIYRIQVSDKISGGEDGIINIQPRQLAERTRWLLNTLLAEHTDEGRHSVVNAMLADDANIAENKLALNVGLATLIDLLTQEREHAAELADAVHALIGTDGTVIQDLVSSVELLWRYADFGFAFEMFLPGLILREMENLAVTSPAIAGDDSLDVSSNAFLYVGQNLLLSDSNGCMDVEIRDVLDKNRVRITTDLPRNYENAVLGDTNWDVHRGYAVCSEGTVYMSRMLYVLERAAQGRLVIRRGESGGELRVFYRNITMGEAWVQVQRDATSESGEEGWMDEWYTLPGGIIQLRIEGESGTTNVSMIAVFPDASMLTADIIRRPVLQLPVANSDVYADELYLRAATFRDAYRDKFKAIQYRVRSEKTSKVYEHNAESLFIVPEEELVPGQYTIEARHISDVDDYSRWSELINIVVMATPYRYGWSDITFYETNGESGTRARRSKGLGHLVSKRGDLIPDPAEDAPGAPFISLTEIGAEFGFLGLDGSLGFSEGRFNYAAENSNI